MQLATNESGVWFQFGMYVHSLLVLHVHGVCRGEERGNMSISPRREMVGGKIVPPDEEMVLQIPRFLSRQLGFPTSIPCWTELLETARRRWSLSSPFRTVFLFSFVR